jgi:threonylcarbamoyladenosine tRNA methylthiotransferase MtaB
VEALMRVSLTTLGCRLNEAEVAGWTRQLAAAGHQVVTTPADAQVAVVNTCAVTGEAARKSRKLIAGIHRRNPSAPIAITGCYSELAAAEAAALAGVDLVIENADKHRLVDRLLSEVEPAAMPNLAAEPESAHAYRETRTRAFVKVQDGCRNRCTFCIVTVARGNERSRSIADVVGEIRELATGGCNEVVLTGVHLGGYGGDLGCTLSDLVRAVLADTDVPRVRLSSLEPWDLPPDFGRLWAHPRLQPHLHLPLQSGSDGVLRRMARRYTTADYAALVDGLRAAIPDLTITTDVIAGFPGESEADHETTVQVVQRFEFAHVHVFAYSRREGTTAARMTGQVAPEIRRRRSRELHAIAARGKRAQIERHLGSVRPVLWEGAGEPLADGTRRWAGYTDNYLRAETVVPASVDVENRITPARLRETDGEIAFADVDVDQRVGADVVVESKGSRTVPDRGRSRLRIVDT